MILRRLGNKSKIAKEIQKHFPPHKIYIEPFFGAGGMFFNKPKAKVNFLNDLDSDVINLFNVVVEQKELFKELLELTPYCTEILQYWMKNQENDPVKKAVRFVYLSNFSFLGKMDCLKIDTGNNKIITLKNYEKTIEFLKDCSLRFTNFDFRKAIQSISIRDNEVNEVLIYCDPPYLGTNDNYSNSFTETDSIDLFDCLEATGCKFAMSEFNNPFILNQVKERGLNVIVIGERQNLKNRRTEVLITNYQKK